jgi:transposase
LGPCRKVGRHASLRTLPARPLHHLYWLDNLGAHKVQGVRQAIEAVGACVVYLPTYSPDFNPIELWWADLKRHLRTLAPRAVDELARVVRHLRAATPREKLAAWFRHCLSFPQLN